MGERTKGLSCLVLGEEPLAARCAELLLVRGHRMSGLVTNSAQLQAWAQKRGILTLRRDEYVAWLQGVSFDVLLSITHPAIISDDVIKSAKIAALNYHDGPLPRYAGMNGSAWALLNGEDHHGWVWHYLTTGLDAGDIVESRRVDLDPRETSLSLNIKNATQALEGFSRVVQRIEDGQLEGTPQRSDVERTVFSRHDRPAAMCVIDWSQSAAAIDRLVRACQFGHFSNPFGCAKLWYRHQIVVVREAQPVASPAEQTTTAAGTVLDVAPDAITVACGTGALLLGRFSTALGQDITPADAALLLKLKKGDRLPVCASAVHFEQSALLARSEPYFYRQLVDRSVPVLPFKKTRGQPVAIPLSLPANFVGRFGANLALATVALFAFALSGVLRQDEFTLALTHRELQEGPLSGFVFPSLPLTVRLENLFGFKAWLAKLAQLRAKLHDRFGFLNDLIARHPALSAQADLLRGEISPVAVVEGVARLPQGAILGLVVAPGGCSIVTDGSVSLNDAELMVRRIVTAAETVANDPLRPLSEIDCLSVEQRQQQLIDWNETQHSYPDMLRLTDPFEHQVAIRPHALALIWGDSTQSFSELDRAANQVANALRELGAAPGQFVGVLVERGLDLVASLLGVAKSGAAYVPIDTRYPADRIDQVLTEAGCEIVVASSALAKLCGGQRQVLLADGSQVRQASPERVACPASASDACYAIFTSGSTGKPKGVVLTHRAVVNTLDWVNRTFEVTEQDRLLFVTSPSFDLSVYDIFGALGAGATVDVASPELLSDPVAMVRYLCQRGITIWDSAPPALARLAPFLPERAPDAKLRLVMLSGDWIPTELPTHLQSVFEGVQVKSLGGATEAAIWSNYFHVHDVDPEWVSIPYGQPIQNARYYILDHHLRPLPATLIGELYIGGVCLAEGYLNRPELTQERFLADPFLAGERIYKTGDLARFWPDGTMEFLGRADHQVKIRGYRVELGEVEAAITALPAVRTALCAAHRDASGQQSLVAYVVGREKLDETELKEALTKQLPDFMVPSYVLFLDALPLSANGKIDRKALPSPEQYQSRTRYAPPSSETQKELVEIWQRVMGRERIGIDDDFFELGGHSLMAVNLVMKLRERFDEDVTLSKILECRTVRKLARALGDVAPASIRPSGRPSKPVPPNDTVHELRAGDGGGRKFFFIYDGEAQTLLYMNLAQRLPPDFQVYGVLPKTRAGIPLAHLTIEDMAHHCVEQLKRYQPHGPYYFGGLCAGGVISFEMASQLEEQGDSVGGLLLLEAFAPDATPRRGVVAQKRLQRLRTVFSSPREEVAEGYTERLLDGSNILLEAGRKVVRAAKYEVSSYVADIDVTRRLERLASVLETGEDWPSWVVPLGTREIYTAARNKYRPRAIQCQNVVLAKATEAVPGVRDDEPASCLYTEAMLGWEPYVPAGIAVLEVRGGHSSMLQVPYVEDLTRQLGSIWDPNQGPLSVQ